MEGDAGYNVTIMNSPVWVPAARTSCGRLDTPNDDHMGMVNGKKYTLSVTDHGTLTSATKEK